MDKDLGQLGVLVQSYIAHEISLEDAARAIVELGFGNGFAIAGGLTKHLHSRDGGRLRELATMVARVSNAT
jgi:hypothetical protein